MSGSAESRGATAAPSEAPGDNGQVLFSVEGAVATITLNRPEKLNSFAGRMQYDLHAFLERARDDERVRAIVITGSGKAFCAGADVTEMRRMVTETQWDEVYALMKIAGQIVTSLRSIAKPIIAAINGAAAGGGANLALACDLRIAGESASIGQVFNRIGLIPDWGGHYFLPRLVGTGKALELALTADMTDAREALRIGLFNKVVPDAELTTATRALAQQLAAKPPMAVALTKQAINKAFDMTLESMLQLELEDQLRCFKTQDVREGFAAYVEKRRPVFTGS